MYLPRPRPHLNHRLCARTLLVLARTDYDVLYQRDEARISINLYTSSYHILSNVSLAPPLHVPTPMPLEIHLPQTASDLVYTVSDLILVREVCLGWGGNVECKQNPAWSLEGDYVYLLGFFYVLPSLWVRLLRVYRSATSELKSETSNQPPGDHQTRNFHCHPWTVS